MQDAVSDERNVVFLVLDSLRTDRVSAYNPAVEFTDHIQELADSATVFENAVTQAPWTLPSHASMFTGEYPWEHGTTHARSYFDDGRKTFVSAFREAGYDTAAITPNVWITPHKGMTGDFDHVENFLGTADNRLSVRLSRAFAKFYHSLGETPRRVLGRQIDRVFRAFDVDDSTRSEETVEAVTDYLGDRGDDDGNFFLYANLMEPHEPYRPPKRYAERHGVAEDAAIPHRQKDVFTMDDIDFDQLERVYDASVDYTDDLVGRVVAALEDNGLREDTVVVLLSDHGQALGEHGGDFGHQFTVSESVVNVVLMVDHPDLEADTVVEPIELRSLSDLVPYYAGIRPAPDPDDVFPETVLGGCEFPENFTGYIPADRWDDYYRKHRYAKRDGVKVVKSVTEDGAATYEAYDLEADKSIPVPPDLKAAVDATGDVASGDIESDDSESGDGTDDAGDRPVDDAVADRLEQLGYR
ncbi:sulfatase [Halopenitus persicus]|uniref:Arylsulfatase A n=1 Tax=Halopenitus persicus TaxID=1048396 RepID=A0A1H3ITG2_9EURY|nr:sulfatase [Halopenitus persicus]SDY30991.1 Arylsulfatase A [Halopenitus persicus]